MESEIYIIVGLILDQKGNNLEWWVEGFARDQDEAEVYADRLNRIHEREDDDERVLYVVASALDIRATSVFDGEYDA